MAANQKNTVDKAKAPELDASKDYTLVGTGKSKAFREGVEATASGADAVALIESGKATLKTTTEK